MCSFFVFHRFQNWRQSLYNIEFWVAFMFYGWMDCQEFKEYCILSIYRKTHLNLDSRGSSSFLNCNLDYLSKVILKIYILKMTLEWFFTDSITIAECRKAGNKEGQISRKIEKLDWPKGRIQCFAKEVLFWPFWS